MVATWALLMTFATQAPEGTEPSGKRQAQVLLDDGLDLYERHDYAAALNKFKQALAVYPSPKLWFNIAQAERDLNRPVEALAAFEKFLATADGPAAAMADARVAVTELRTRLSRLRLRSGERGLEVSVDGRTAGRTPFVSDVWVLPGTHVLVIGSGTTSASTTVTVAVGGTEEVVLPWISAKEPATAAPNPPAPLPATPATPATIAAPAPPSPASAGVAARADPPAHSVSSVGNGWALIPS